MYLLKQINYILPLYNLTNVELLLRLFLSAPKVFLTNVIFSVKSFSAQSNFPQNFLRFSSTRHNIIHWALKTRTRRRENQEKLTNHSFSRSKSQPDKVVLFLVLFVVKKAQVGQRRFSKTCLGVLTTSQVSCYCQCRCSSLICPPSDL